MNNLLNLLIIGIINLFKTILKDLCGDIIKYIKEAEQIQKTIEKNDSNSIMTVLFSLFEYTPTPSDIVEFKNNSSKKKFEYVFDKVVDNSNKKFINMLIELLVYSLFNMKNRR